MGRNIFRMVVLPCLPFNHGVQRTLERQSIVVARLLRFMDQAGRARRIKRDIECI